MRLLLAFIALFAAVPPAFAFPAGSGFINVRDFGAAGDGVTDDTAAINAALAASGDDTGPAFWQDRIVYFPAGTYRVSDRIVKRYREGRFASGAVLIGAARDSTVIRLGDGTPGYDDPADPRAVIFTTARLLDGNATSGGKDYISKGEGNDAFMNFVEDLTIDTGHNPGAIGIDYLANNIGAIRRVTVKGNGATGIAMTRKWPGPALLQDVTVDGFDIGIDIANSEYGMTLEDVRLLHQRRIGLRNDHNVVAIHDLTVENAPLPIGNLSPDGLIVIDGGDVKTDNPSAAPAIENNGFLNLRDITIDGYAAMKNGVYEKRKYLGTARQSWSLSAKDPPEPLKEPFGQWVAVSQSDPDATQAIRRAFASGAGTVYFPHGIYLVSANIDVPASVRRIVGMTSTIRPATKRPADFRREQGMLRLHNDASPLVIERLAFDNSFMGDQVAVEAAGSQPVVLRDIVGAGVTTLLRPASGGEAFLENTCCGTISVAGGKGVWARQLDSEGPGVRIRNDGAPLWILGIKTERDCTVLDNSGGARTEILGGLLYITGSDADPTIPAFRNTDARLALSYAEESFNEAATYKIHLIDTQKGRVSATAATSLPRRNTGRMVPLLVAQ